LCDPTRLGRDSIIYLDISSIDRDSKRIVAPQQIAVDEAPSRARKRVRTNDVLVSTVRPNLNSVALVPPEYHDEIASTGFCVLRAKDSVLSPVYLFYYCQTTGFVARLTKLSIGAGYPAIGDGDILDAEIPLPPLPKQKRIVSILSKADRLRRLRRYARTLSDEYLQSVFLEMFGDPVMNSKGWKAMPLGDLIDGFVAGVNYRPVSEGEHASAWRVLKVSAVTWGEFDPTASKPIRSDVEVSEDIIVRRGDMLMSRANTTELVGAVCIVRAEPPQVVLPDKIWRVRFRCGSRVSPDYLLHALRHPGLRRRIGELATGTSGSMKNISMQKAATLPVSLAPMHLQERFHDLVRGFEHLRATQREAERQAQHLFQTLLHRAFQGDL
jgi:type I restriction enzyme S subunit